MLFNRLFEEGLIMQIHFPFLHKISGFDFFCGVLVRFCPASFLNWCLEKIKREDGDNGRITRMLVADHLQSVLETLAVADVL